MTLKAANTETNQSKIIYLIFQYHQTGTRICIDYFQGIHGYAKIFLLLILSKGNARNCVLKDYTSNHCLWGDTKQTWSRLSILTTNTRLLSNPYFQYLTEVFRDITIRFSNHMQELLFRNIFFCHRVVESWNSLSSDIIDSDTVDSFRRRLMRIVPSGQDNFLLTK